MTGLLPLLEEFYREKLAMMLRHQAAATVVGQYDANNTYQYIIAREDVQLSWVASAIGELGGTVPSQVDAGRAWSEKGSSVAQGLLEQDARDAQGFVDRWRPRVESMSHARHRGMLRVILGEVLEHKRFFEQALAGRSDLLGRRADVLGPSHGEVLPTRWIE
ncbi:MAG: hypothetical protein C5B57_05480 [Blastocatellia bacterium]|nr:MAG: hypothetical protein C5B57_05480 [Blastocatellia bacterium]